MRARDNPFAVRRVLKLRYRLSESGWDELLARLERLDHRAAIVGAEGSGKTTPAALGREARRRSALGARRP
jgi:hypothetical protein